jgi:predicted pyridoxine 5'-phosphate oxidase superfamily flavin-nucleotide-binding protein
MSGGAFHAGELLVQERAGTRDSAAKIGRGIRTGIGDPMREFLAAQSMAVVSSLGPDGRVWASLLSGPPGFLRSTEERTLDVAGRPAPGDPLEAALRPGTLVGLMSIDFASRRRVRVNGSIETAEAGAFRLRVAQAYGNCQRYIQQRSLRRAGAPARGDGICHSAGLFSAQQSWIAAADTFFIASHHPCGGADASHRGGNPGFVQVTGPTGLLIPDYAGNTMFNTLGNLAHHPNAGLLFVDFERGATLQLTGVAQILWDDPRAAAFAGAQRLLSFTIDQVIEIEAVTALRWSLEERSPHNPK